MKSVKLEINNTTEAPDVRGLSLFLVRLGFGLVVGLGLVVGVAAIVGGDAVLGWLAFGLLALGAVAGWQWWRQRPSTLILGVLGVAMVGALAPFLDVLMGMAVLIGLAALGGLVALLLERRPGVYYITYLGVVITLSVAASHQQITSSRILALFVVGVSFFGVATAYDQIAKRIRAGEQQYRELFETAADAIISMDGNNRVVLFNGQAESMFGFRAGEVIGESLAMLLPDRFRKVHPDHVQGFAEGRISQQFMATSRAITGLRSNGEEFPIEITVSKRTVDGHLEFTAVLRDVTAQVRAVEQRELVQECVTAIAASEDADTALAGVLHSVCEYTGWLVGEAWIPSADGSQLERSDAFYARSEGMNAFRNATKSIVFEQGLGLHGQVWASKQPLVIADVVTDPRFLGGDLAAQFGIHAAVAVPALADHEIVAILVFFLAASPADDPQLVETISTVASQLGSSIRRKRAEEAQRVSEARNRAMLEALPDLVYRLDADGTYLSYQMPQGSRLFALPERLVGDHIVEALPKDLADQLQDAVERAHESGQVQLWLYQYEIEGQIRDREARVFPIPGSDETMVIVRDITDRVANQKALEASLRSKNELIASIAHELRTPLTAVVGFAQILQDQTSALTGDERAEMIQTIAREGADLTNIVEDLLTAAKVEAGTLTVVRVPVDLRAQAAQILETWDLPEAGHIEITGTATRAIADPARVRQILRNLISNALKYGGHTVHITVDSGQTASRVSVIDDGPGISETDRERIFESYQRAHDAPGLTTSLGLGLTIARHLARLMNGDLTYQHSSGKTIFELTLPITEGQPSPKGPW